MTHFFAKLNTRSPKDAHETCVFKNIKDFVGALAGSMRCFDDLCMLIHIDKAAVVIRPVFDIPKRNEWRVFVKDGKFQGMSQYFYDQEFDYTDSELLLTRVNVQEFVERIAVPNIFVESFVIDVFLQNFYSPPIIIETNPYGLSDPCVFESYDNIRGLAIVK